MLLCLWSLSAASTGNQIAQARNLYYQGIYGDRASGERADDLFAHLHQQQPDNPVVTVYLGSLRLVEAEHTWALWRKNSLSKEGIHLMDSAIAAAPQNLEIRFVRGATERELPGFFGRKQQAKDDLKAIVKAPALAQQQWMEPRLIAASFYYYGLDCENAGTKPEALEAWRTSVRIAPDSHSGRLAAEKLKALS